MKRTIYHSHEWDRLIEHGYLTLYIETMPDGTKIAGMQKKIQIHLYI